MLYLLDDLWSNLHLWSRALGSERKNKMLNNESVKVVQTRGSSCGVARYAAEMR